MNEKIKQLAEQAGLRLNSYLYKTDAGELEVSNDFKNFAELIIRECIGVVRADGDHWEKLSQNPSRGQEHFRDHMLYAAYRLKEDAVWSIEEHFGLETSPPYGDKE